MLGSHGVTLTHVCVGVHSRHSALSTTYSSPAHVIGFAHMSPPLPDGVRVAIAGPVAGGSVAGGSVAGGVESVAGWVESVAGGSVAGESVTVGGFVIGCVDAVGGAVVVGTSGTAAVVDDAAGLLATTSCSVETLRDCLNKMGPNIAGLVAKMGCSVGMVAQSLFTYHCLKASSHLKHVHACRSAERQVSGCWPLG